MTNLLDFLALRVTRGSIVEVDIEGCAVEMETVLHCAARDSKLVGGQGGSLYSRITDGA